MTKQPYKPDYDPDESLLALCGLTIWIVALVVLILALFGGCSNNPIAPTNDTLTVERSCASCHILQIEPLSERRK